MRLLMLRLQNQKDTSKGKGRGNRVHEGLINGAKGLIAYPGVFALHSSKRERNTLISILAKASHYLSENLILDGTLHGKHEFDKNIGIHLGVFALYEYVPDTSSVSAHNWKDFPFMRMNNNTLTFPRVSTTLRGMPWIIPPLLDNN